MQDEFSSSEVELEVAVSKAVETDAIPALEKLQKVGFLNPNICVFLIYVILGLRISNLKLALICTVYI